MGPSLTTRTGDRSAGSSRLPALARALTGARLIAALGLALGVGSLPVSAMAQGSSEETYESPTYGYTVTYDPEVWEVFAEESSGDVDTFVLDGIEVQTRIQFIGGTDFGGDSEACLAAMVETAEEREGVTSFGPFEEGGEPAEGELEEGDGVYATYLLTGEGDNGEYEAVDYLSCQVVEEGESNLLIEQQALSDDWDAATELREDLLATLEIQGAQGDDEEATEEPEDEAEATPEDETEATPVEDDEADEEATPEDEEPTSGGEFDLGEDATVIEDDMSSARRGVLSEETPAGFEDDVTYEYTGGEFVITTLNEAAGGWQAAPPGEYSDVVFAIDARFEGEFEDRYLAIGCRSTFDEENNVTEYRLTLDVATGTVSLALWNAGEEEVLDEVEGLESVSTTDFNRLQIACVGEEITGSINGEEVVSATDDTATEGIVYFAAGPYSDVEATIEAHFDNLTLQGIEV